MSMDEKLQAVKDDLRQLAAITAKLKADEADLHAEITKEVALTGAQVASDTKAADVKPA